MERLLDIKKEIQEKKGKEWVGLQEKTEKQLHSLMWYLDHPKLHQDSKLAEEIIEHYYMAKASGFLKMEGIIRKLDQLGVSLGKADPSDVVSSGKVQAINYGQAIIELKQEIEELLGSSYGQSLPQSTQDSITILLNYLDHPNLPNKPKLFDDMSEKYKMGKASDFTTMQAFNQMLNMAEIKLGKVTEIRKVKTVEELRKDLEEEKERLLAEQENLESEKKELEAAKEHMEAVKKNLEEERKELETAKENMEAEKKKLNQERNELNSGKESLKTEKNKFEEERKEFEAMTESIETEKKKLEEEKEKFEVEKDRVEVEKGKIEVEKGKIEVEKSKLEAEWKKLEEAKS